MATESIEQKFARLAEDAGQYSLEVAAAYETFMAAGDVDGWNTYCRELQELRDTAR